MLASEKGLHEVVEALIKSGCDVNKARNDGATPLSFAAQNGHPDVAERLLAAQRIAQIYFELNPPELAKYGHTAADVFNARHASYRQLDKENALTRRRQGRTGGECSVLVADCCVPVQLLGESRSDARLP